MPTRSEISAVPGSSLRSGRRSAALLVLATLFVLFCPAKNAAQTPSQAITPTPAQAPLSGEIKGSVSDGNKPLAGARLTLANAPAGKSFQLKTDDYGRFILEDAPYGYYDVEVVSADGERLLQQQISIVPAGSARTATMKIDVSQSKMSAQPGDPEVYGRMRTLPAPNIKNTQKLNKALKAQNEQALQMNALILQMNAAVREQRWPDALAPALELTGIEPDNWEYLGELGDVQYHLGQYQEAIGSYESGILAAGDISGSDAQSGDAELARRKSSLSRMLNNEGLAYNKLHKTKEAIGAFYKAAAIAADPSLAYFNLCVTQYNLKNVEGTMAACDKAISVNPRKADAYYYKGALLVYVNQRVASAKAAAPPAEAAEALSKYLELAPEGEHAAEVRKMLNYLASSGNAPAGDKKN